jgi:hypothetical protein
MDWMLNQILSWLTGLILDSLDGIFNLLTHALYVTPDVTGLPQVAALTTRSVWIVDTVFVLAFVAAGVMTITSGTSAGARYHIKNLAPRLIVGFVAAHFSTLFCGQAIGLANALVGSVAGGQGDPQAATRAMRSHLTAAGSSQASVLLFLVILAIIAILVGAATFGLIARLSLLLVLTAIAPIALACHALPATDGLARAWWRSYLGTLLVPVLQAFTLQAGMWMLTDPTHILPEIPIAGGAGVLLNLFVVMVILWYTVKMPGLVRKHILNSGARDTTVIGGLIRIAAVSTAGRVVPGASRVISAVRP